MRLSACLCIVLISFLEGVSCSCPSQCTCDYHGRNDGTGSRYAPLLAIKCSNDFFGKGLQLGSLILKANC